MPLLLELGRIEGRMLEDVSQDVGGEGDVVGQDPGVVGGVLARGVSVQAAADPLDLLGDRPGRAPARALERHVLEHVGDAIDLGRLVAGADVDPDPQRGGLQARHRFADDAQAIGDGRDFDGVDHAVPNLSRTAASTAAGSLSRTGQRSGRCIRSA